MKKKVKLFSSALALGMLLGTGAGSLSVVTQQVPGTTMTAKAAEGSEVKLSEDQVIVDYGGYITGIHNLSSEDIDKLLTNGALNIPVEGTNYSGQPTTITGISYDAFSKTNLQSISGLKDFAGLKSVTFANGSQIEEIRSGAFHDNQLTNISLPEKVETIGAYAFQNNQLTSVSLPENLNTIRYRAFQNNKLTNVSIPEKVEIIEENTFQNNQLTSVTLPENLNTIEYGAFQDNKLTNVSIPEKVETIENYTFQDNQLTNVTLPENLKTIKYSAFQSNKLTDVSIPGKVEVIEQEAFRGNELTNVKFPDSIKNISDHAFSENQLEQVKLTSIELLGYEAFSRNKIKSISINKDHKYIHNQEGTINNPYVWSPFNAQDWGNLTMDYSPNIANKDFENKIDITYDLNDLEPGSDKYSVESVSSANNISWNRDQDDDGITVKSEEGGTATIGLNLSRKPLEISGFVNLTVTPFSDPNEGNGNENNNNGGGSGGDNSGGTTQPDNNNNGNNNNGGTTQPDTDNNNNATPSTPATPGTSNDHPYSVYATRAMRLHKNVSLTSPTKSYKKQSRSKAPSFKIQGVAYDKNGKKRYKVNGGYITASSKYVADSHFRSNKVKRVRVIGNKVNSYKDVKLSKNQKLGSYKKGTKLNISRIVKYGRTTRFQLTNGRYVTGNKQLLIMDQK